MRFLDYNYSVRLKDIWWDIKSYFIRQILGRTYYLNAVQEMIFNPKYQDYVAGRIEVWYIDNCYNIDEQRFFTKRGREFYQKISQTQYKMLTKKRVDKVLKSLEEYNEKM